MRMSKYKFKMSVEQTLDINKLFSAADDEPLQRVIRKDSRLSTDESCPLIIYICIQPSSI